MRIIESNEFDIDVSVWDLNDSQWDAFKEDVDGIVSQYHADWHIPYPGNFVIGIQPGFDLDKDEIQSLAEDLHGVLEDWRGQGWPRDSGAVLY